MYDVKHTVTLDISLPSGVFVNVHDIGMNISVNARTQEGLVDSLDYIERKFLRGLQEARDQIKEYYAEPAEYKRAEDEYTYCNAPGPEIFNGPWYCEREEGHSGKHWFPKDEYTYVDPDYPETWA